MDDLFDHMIDVPVHTSLPGAASRAPLTECWRRSTSSSRLLPLPFSRLVIGAQVPFVRRVGQEHTDALANVGAELGLEGVPDQLLPLLVPLAGKARRDDVPDQ